MQAVVNWGILGAAKFAREHMAPAIHAAKGARLAALATSAEEKAQGFKEFCPDLKVHLSYEDLLADPSIDAVYIPLPNHLHVEWVKKAVAVGKHVLCEKPIAMKAEEIDELIALRDASGLLVAEAYMIVHHPQWQRARELVQTGAIGDLLHVDGFFSYDNRADTSNIRNRPETGGGAIPDIGVYTYGSARFVTGEEPVSATAQIMRENGVDVVSHAQAQFPSFTYAATVSMRMFPRQEMTFHGTEGIVRLTAPFNANVYSQAEIVVDQPGMAKRIERFPGVNHYMLQVENFGRSVREGADYPCPLEFSRGTQAMIDMIFAAE
ncbi:Gfo/Idh/MocA family protein [Pseudoruegeria sp. SHC-113]|uniref:Gfo/Idh/MocA family protein n=1 Tax=Pseudoruegeria sp. SHC-113 TaxID=2855439 RepID=UPI0021BB4775|nr:Gfo/Idh/MocA family oxidoreductase [Pseudoruegeria sp. SHC-113]MCT8160818.1 Gfo/Idh/MocA family oxidoreductase [Pseudoruegeria sp. SHC-113]